MGYSPWGCKAQDVTEHTHASLSKDGITLKSLKDISLVTYLYVYSNNKLKSLIFRIPKDYINYCFKFPKLHKCFCVYVHISIMCIMCVC